MESSGVQSQMMYLILLLQLRLREHCGKRNGKIVRAEEWRVHSKIELYRSVRTHTHEVPPTWLPKDDLNKEDIDRSVSVMM